MTSSKPPELLDAVMLLTDLRAAELTRGMVGTVVELLQDDHVEVEFCHDDGSTLASVAIHRASLQPLSRHCPVTVSASQVPEKPND